MPRAAFTFLPGLGPLLPPLQEHPDRCEGIQGRQGHPEERPGATRDERSEKEDPQISEEAGEPPTGCRNSTTGGASADRLQTSHACDELVDPVVDGLERVFAQHRALRLVVELEMHPVDCEVAAFLLRAPDEFTA